MYSPPFTPHFIISMSNYHLFQPCDSAFCFILTRRICPPSFFKNYNEEFQASLCCCAFPLSSPSPLIAGVFTRPSFVPVSVVPPQRRNDPQAVNLNEAESWAGLGRTRPYGCVSDRGMRREGERDGGKGQGWRGRTEQAREWGKLTWQNEKERKGVIQLRTKKLEWLKNNKSKRGSLTWKREEEGEHRDALRGANYLALIWM